MLSGLSVELRFLGGSGDDGLEPFGLADFDDSAFVEDGETFADNARKKAEYYYELFDRRWPTMGEDSGILVDALEGELGVKTRRWGAGEKATDEAWIAYFMDVMSAVPEGERGAKFVCNACLVGLEGEDLQFEGETRGVITAELETPIAAGIPLSSCFRPEGFEEVYQSLSVEEKNGISHRGKALKELRRAALRSEFFTGWDLGTPE